MANPYHDENGRFSSKAAMQGSIARLLKEGNFEAYNKLKSEYETIEAEKVGKNPRGKNPTTDPNNTFKNIQTLEKLEEAYEIMTSPENLHMDGEIGRGRAQARFRKLNKEYLARKKEIETTRIGVPPSNEYNMFAHITNTQTLKETYDNKVKTALIREKRLGEFAHLDILDEEYRERLQELENSAEWNLTQQE